MSINLQTLTISKARAMLLSGETTSVDLVTAYIKEIESHNKNLNLFLEVFTDVLDQAKAADAIYKNDIEKAKQMPLLGIPVATKDNIMIKGRHAQSGSHVLDGYVASYDSTATTKLRNAGAIFIGRTNMDEFAMGSSTETSYFGPAKNPHDDTRVPGGSSGGSAGVVAAHMALASLGSDTGGSVRQPASLCGIVGLKPTYGSISRHGLMALGSSLDVIGTFSNSVSDAKIMFDVLKGKDVMDMTSVEADAATQKAAKELTLPTMKKKIGVLKGVLDLGGIDDEVKENTKKAIAFYESRGYEIVEIDIPLISYGIATYYVIMPAEASSNLARFDGVKYGLKVDGNNLLEDYLKTRREGFGAEVRRRIMLGTYVLSSGYHDAYYNKALKVRDMLKADFAKAFEKVDAILTPTAPTPAFKLGSKTNDPIAMYLEDIFTVTANLTGTPAISIPSGFTTGEKSDGKKLPLGIQLTAPHLHEEVLFALGSEFEENFSK